MANRNMTVLAIVAIGIIIPLTLLGAPWMTEEYCITKLNEEGIYGKGSEPYRVSWFPFGRRVYVSRLTDEEQQAYLEQGIIGGYGATYFVTLYGDVQWLIGN